MDGRPTWTDCDETGDYVVPNVLSPRDLVFRPDNMDETVPHTHRQRKMAARFFLHGDHLAIVVLSGTPLLRPVQYDRTFLRSVQYDRTFLDSVQ